MARFGSIVEGTMTLLLSDVRAGAPLLAADGKEEYSGGLGIAEGSPAVESVGDSESKK